MAKETILTIFLLSHVDLVNTRSVTESVAGGVGRPGWQFFKNRTPFTKACPARK